MGIIIQANFQNKLSLQLSKYRPSDKRPEYQKETFRELCSNLPQFKAHVAAYIERNYCGVVINDEDHSNPDILIDLITFDELLKLNSWIADRKKPIVLK